MTHPTCQNNHVCVCAYLVPCQHLHPVRTYALGHTKSRTCSSTEHQVHQYSQQVQRNRRGTPKGRQAGKIHTHPTLGMLTMPPITLDAQQPHISTRPHSRASQWWWLSPHANTPWPSLWWDSVQHYQQTCTSAAAACGLRPESWRTYRSIYQLGTKKQ